MTVKEIVKVLLNVEIISICFGDQAHRIARNDSLMLGVFGDYVVDGVYTDDGKAYELNIAMQPIKEV